MTDHTTAAQATKQEGVLTDDEINDICEWPASNTTMRAENDRALARAIESALLSKLRAPKPLGDSCHHCGWMDWVSQDGVAYCQACGKPHGSVPAEGLPNLPQLLRENADLDEAEGGNAQVCALERDAADEIERLRREVAKLRAPVADERSPSPCPFCGGAAFATYKTDDEGMRWHSVHCKTGCDGNGKHGTEKDAIAAWNARAALASAPVAGEAVGKVVLFGGDLKEVSWTAGKMPPPGTTLYAALQAGPVAGEAQEPAEYQRRCRPTWENARVGWTEWERCTAAQAADSERAPLVHDWQYEVRRLYTAPQGSPVAGKAMPIELQHQNWASLKEQLGSAGWTTAESIRYRGFFLLGVEAAIEFYAAPQASEAVPWCLLAAEHVGMTVDYTGLLGQARSALKRGENAPAMAEMLRQLAVHLTELGQRWYAGDASVVDEFLQLYCVESDTRAALSAQPGAQKGCKCATCRPHNVEMRMILCETCGDKRCPHAADHRNTCTQAHPDNKDGGAVYG